MWQVLYDSVTVTPFTVSRPGIISSSHTTIMGGGEGFQVGMSFDNRVHYGIAGCMFLSAASV